ncbi:MAG: hypothetical protein GY720_05160 [bacterium]|nr:hypothetical protein [bacterium]
MKTLSALIIAALLLASCSDSGDVFEFTFSTDECPGDRIPTSHVVAVDLATGEPNWSQRIPYSADSSPRVELVGDRLVFAFSTAEPSGEPDDPIFGGAAALSTAGEPLWQETLGMVDGFGVVDEVVVMSVIPDVGRRTEMGIAVADGTSVWRHPADSWDSPLLMGPIALFEGGNGVRARQASTGDEMWFYGSDGISTWGSLTLDGRAVVPVVELAKYIDVDLDTGEAIEIDTASGGGAVRVIALTPHVVVGHEEWWATDDRGKKIAVAGLFGYDRDTWQEVWHRDVANAWGVVWAGGLIVKPGRNIRVFNIETGAEVAKIPAGHRDRFEFATSRRNDILIGYDGIVASYANRELSEMLIGSATEGAWEIDENRTLVASTRLDGTHQVAMMNAELTAGLWSAKLDMPADHVVLGEDAAYVVMSDASCTSF